MQAPATALVVGLEVGLNRDGVLCAAEGDEAGEAGIGKPRDAPRGAVQVTQRKRATSKVTNT